MEFKVDRIVHYDGSEITQTIGELFNDMSYFGCDEIFTPNTNEVLNLNGIIEVKSINHNGVVGNYPASEIIRHKVNKPKWEVTCESGDSVTVTGDHSCVVFRDNIPVDLPTNELVVGDIMLLDNNTPSGVYTTIKSVGVVGQFDEEYVYDIGMADDQRHVFFANDILVHNSNYYDISSLVRHYYPDGFDWDDDNLVKEVAVHVDSFVGELNKFCYDVLVKRVCRSSVDTIEFKREVIASTGIFLKKKNYILKVRDDEGKILNKFKYTGVAMKKKELAPAVIDLLLHIVESGVDEGWTDDDIEFEMSKVWDDFKLLTPDEIGFYRNLRTPKASVGFLKAEAGAQTHARSVVCYNQMLEILNIKGGHMKIKPGDRFRYVHIKPNNEYRLNAIAYSVESGWPKEFDAVFKLDYRLMFTKMVIAKTKDIMACSGWHIPRPQEGRRIANIMDI